MKEDNKRSEKGGCEGENTCNYFYQKTSTHKNHKEIIYSSVVLIIPDQWNNTYIYLELF